MNDRIYDLVTLQGPLTNKQIWLALGTVKYGSVRNATRQLQSQGLLQAQDNLINHRNVKVYYVE